MDQEREQKRWVFPKTAHKCHETRCAGPEGKKLPGRDIIECEAKTKYFCLDHQCNTSQQGFLPKVIGLVRVSVKVAVRVRVRV
jgi:hypothetical protein